MDQRRDENIGSVRPCLPPTTPECRSEHRSVSARVDSGSRADQWAGREAPKGNEPSEPRKSANL